VTTEIRCVTKTEGYNDVFEVTVARSKVEIMSHGNDILHVSATSELCIRCCSTRKRRGNVSYKLKTSHEHYSFPWVPDTTIASLLTSEGSESCQTAVHLEVQTT